MNVPAGKTSKPVRETIRSRAVCCGQPASKGAVNILRISIKVIPECTKTSEINIGKPERNYRYVNSCENATNSKPLEAFEVLVRENVVKCF